MTPRDAFVQLEVLALCPAEGKGDPTLVVLARTLDLPFRFDTLRLVTRRVDDGKELSARPLLEPAYRKRLKRQALRPLYDVEAREALAAAREALAARGCASGASLPAASLQAVAEIAGWTHLIDVDLPTDAKSDAYLVRLSRQEGDKTKKLGEARRTIPRYLEGRKTTHPLPPAHLVQLLAFVPEGYLPLVLRSVDPSRSDVPPADTLVTFRLKLRKTPPPQGRWAGATRPRVRVTPTGRSTQALERPLSRRPRPRGCRARRRPPARDRPGPAPRAGPRAEAPPRSG